MTSPRAGLSIPGEQRKAASWKQGALSFTLTLLAGLAILVLTQDAWAQPAASGQATAAGRGAPQSPTCGPDWQALPSYNPSPQDNYFSGAVAVSSDDVWGVGAYANTTLGRFQTLVENWNGTSWGYVSSPNQSAGSNILSAVAAVSGIDMWAVGNYFNTSTITRQTLIEHWNGSTWSIMPSPNAGASHNDLNGVTRVGPLISNDVWAVGDYYNTSTSPESTLTEHWNGSTWSVVHSPNAGTGDNRLNSVTAAAPNDVWAVGYYIGSPLQQTLIEHWNGSAWSIMPSPNVTGDENTLSSVYAISTDDIWAVGYYFVGSDARALTEHWDGIAWSIVPSANPDVTGGYYLLTGVSATSETNAWAVGYYQDSAHTVEKSLVEHYNGSGWHVVPSPNPGAGYNALNTVAMVSDTDMWALGDQSNLSSFPPQTLTERYHPCASLICGMQFQDVPSYNSFYLNIEAMACQTIVTGYPCGGLGQPCVPPTNYPYFLPNNNVTRGQIAKIVALSAGLTTTVSGQTFQDVPPGSTFYTYVEQLAALGVMGGYTCGGPGEPCVPPTNRPYFRPNSSATRGQLAKIDSNTVGFSDTPTGQIFQDVPSSNPFYTWIERLAERGIMSGYTCGAPGEPCVPPGNLPYFLPNNNVTRGQTSKIVANTFFP